MNTEDEKEEIEMEKSFEAEFFMGKKLNPGDEIIMKVRRYHKPLLDLVGEKYEDVLYWLDVMSRFLISSRCDSRRRVASSRFL